MAHRIPTIDGDEYDALTPSRKYHRWRAGERRRIKRRYNRRVRRLARLTSTAADSRELAAADDSETTRRPIGQPS